MGWKENLAPFHAAAMTEEDGEDFGRVIATVVGGIEVEENPTAWSQSPFQVFQKEIPIGRTPTPSIFTAPLESGGERSDEIEFATKIRQRFKRANAMHFALDLQQIDQGVEHWHAGQIKPNAMMTEVLGDKEKKTAAATKIEDLLRRQPVEIKVLRALDIDR